MPVFWNLDPVWRNQVIVGAFLLFFCPWPWIPMIYVCLLAAGSNDCDEEKQGLTWEEHLEEYFSYYGYGIEEVEIVLKENSDYRNVYLKLGSKENMMPKDKYDEGIEFMRTGKRPEKIPTWYDVDNNDYSFEYTSEGFDVLQEIMDRAMDDWDTVVPVIVEEADVFFESLDYWYQKQLLLENDKFVKEMRTRNTLRQQKRGQANKVSSYYLKSHLDIWLSAIPFYERVSYTVRADRLLAERLQKEPMQDTLIL